MALQKLLLLPAWGGRPAQGAVLEDAAGASCSCQRQGCQAAAAVHAVCRAPGGSSQAQDVVPCSQQARLRGAVAAVLLRHVLHMHAGAGEKANKRFGVREGVSRAACWGCELNRQRTAGRP